MQARADRKSRKEKEKDGIGVATAKLAVSTITGHVVAQQVAVAMVEGGRAAQAARVAGRASLLDYVPGGDYAKLATGQKLSRADSLAMLGQHGGRDIAQKNGLSPHAPKRSSALFSAVSASAKKRQEQGFTESIDSEVGKERGWTRSERENMQGSNSGSDDTKSGSGLVKEQDSMSHPSEKEAKIDQAGQAPGTQIEQDPAPKKQKEALKEKGTEMEITENAKPSSGIAMTPEQYEEHMRREQERDPGPTMKPY